MITIDPSPVMLSKLMPVQKIMHIRGKINSPTPKRTDGKIRGGRWDPGEVDSSQVTPEGAD